MRDKYDDIKVDGKSITRLQQVIHLAVRACRMIWGSVWICQSPRRSEKDLQQRSPSAAANLVCTQPSPLGNLVRSANLSGTSPTDMPVRYSSVMVYIVRNHLQGTTVNLATSGGGRGFGVDRGAVQMLNWLDLEPTRRKVDPWPRAGWLYEFLEVQRQTLLTLRRSQET